MTDAPALITDAIGAAWLPWDYAAHLADDVAYLRDELADLQDRWGSLMDGIRLLPGGERVAAEVGTHAAMVEPVDWLRSLTDYLAIMAVPTVATAVADYHHSESAAAIRANRAEREALQDATEPT